jgi:group I intron endonuclease
MTLRTLYIYSITHIDSGKCYIGSTWNTKVRFRQHKRFLRKGIHHCAYLQRSWDKYGKDAFEFAIVHAQDIEKPQRDPIEIEWIAKLATFNTYKVNASRQTFEHDESSKQKIREANLARFADPQVRQSLSDKAKARWADDEWRESVAGIYDCAAMHTPEVVAKRNETCRTQENRARLSANSKTQWLDPNYAEMMSRLSKERTTTPEAIAGRVARNKAQWADPAYVEKMRNSHNTPEAIAKRKRLGADPERRASITAKRLATQAARRALRLAAPDLFAA